MRACATKEASTAMHAIFCPSLFFKDAGCFVVAADGEGKSIRMQPGLGIGACCAQHLVCRLLDIPVSDCLFAGTNQRCVRFLAERMDAIDPEMSTVPPELDFRVKCSGMQVNTVRRSCDRQILWLVLDVTTMNLHMRSIALR